MSINSTASGLNTLGFIQENSLTYTEIQRDLTTFVNALTEDEKLGFKTLFEGTNGQILLEVIAAKSSDEIYHIITSRSENLMYYLNRRDSAIAIAQNSSYSAGRGSNIKLKLTITPSSTVLLNKFDSLGSAEEYNLVVAEDVQLTANTPVTIYCYVGNVKEQTLIADSEDLLVFRFTNQNVSDQIALFLDGEEVPITNNILGMLDDKYFTITNAYSSVDAIYLNKRRDFTHRYTNTSQLKLKYIEFADITLSSLNIISEYGNITSATQESGTIQPESVSSIRQSAPLYAETQNRIVARDDFAKVLEDSHSYISDAQGYDYSNAQVEVTYVKGDGSFLTTAQYNEIYNDLYRKRAYGIPMCRLSHPEVMLKLKPIVTLQLAKGTTATVNSYIRQVFANYEYKLGQAIDFTDLENGIESYKFVKTARISFTNSAWTANTLSPEGTTYKPTTANGKLYVVRNIRSLTGATEPTWNSTVGQTTVDNDIVWTCENKYRTPQNVWTANTAEVLDSIVWPTDTTATVQYRCTGFTYKTGASEPTWGSTEGSITYDNQIIWEAVEKNLSAPAWTANTIVSKGTVVNSTALGSTLSLQAIGYVPKTSASEPTWPTTDTLFTDGAIQYAILPEECNPEVDVNFTLTLNWNQYVKFDETIRIV